MAKKLVFFTDKGGECTPCKEINKLVEEGFFDSTDTDEVDLIDISTDEGWERFNEEVLSKEDGAVPSAYLDGKKCRIEMTEDNIVHFNCQDPPG